MKLLDNVRSKVQAMRLDMKQRACSHHYGMSDSTVVIEHRPTKYRGKDIYEGICKECGAKVQSGVNVWIYDSRAVELIMQVFDERGSGDAYRQGRCGSYWLCEFKTEVSEYLDQHGEEATIAYLRNVTF